MLDDVPKIYKYLTFAVVIGLILALFFLVFNLIFNIFHSPSPSGPPTL